MTSALQAASKARTRWTIPSGRGRADGRVGRGGRRQTIWWRRRPFWVAGVVTASSTHGGGRRIATTARYRERGRGQRGPGGPGAHLEGDGGLGEAGGGRTAPATAAGGGREELDWAGSVRPCKHGSKGRKRRAASGRRERRAASGGAADGERGGRKNLAAWRQEIGDSARWSLEENERIWGERKGAGS